MIYPQNLITMAISYFIVHIGWYLWFFLLPLYMRKLNTPEFFIGLSYSLFIFSSAILNIVGGILADKLGRKKMVVSTTFLLFIWVIILSYIKDWHYFMLMCIFMHGIFGLLSPAFFSIIVESVRKDRIGTALSITETSWLFGAILGPIFGKLLLGKMAIPQIMIITSITLLFCGIIRLIWLKETKEKNKKLNNVKLNKNLLFLLISNICFTIISYIGRFGPFIALYFKDTLKFTEEKINMFFSYYGIGMLIGSLFGKIVDKVGGKYMFSLSIILCPLLFIICVFLNDFHLFFLAFLFDQLTRISFMALITKHTDIDIRGRIIGLFGTISGIFATFAPSIGMIIKERFNYLGTFSFSLLFGIIGALFILRLSEK